MHIVLVRKCERDIINVFKECGESRYQAEMKLPEIVLYFNVGLWNSALKKITRFYATEAVRAP